MNRDYDNGAAETVTFFFGEEIEHTPAFGKYTLFVVGVQNIQDIAQVMSQAEHPLEHIFFGANHSFHPYDNLDWQRWETMIEYFLEKDYLCSLDIPISHAEEFLENGLNERNNFIPQIRVPLPYIKLWNYNTMIKIDDKDFNATNPGVWSHSLHKLMDRNNFTSWDKYKEDKIA